MSDSMIVLVILLWIGSGYVGAYLLRRKGRYDTHLRGHEMGDPLDPDRIVAVEGGNFIDPLLAYRLWPIFAGASLLVAALVLPAKPVQQR